MIPGGGNNRVIPEGVQLPPGTEGVGVISDAVSEDYFSVLDIPIVEGRQFAVTDRADSPRVAIVNQLFARKYYPNGSAVGRRFRLDSAAGPLIQIVGVARQSKYFFPVEPPVDYVYFPLAQQPRTGMTLMLHTAGAPGDLAAPLRNLVRSLDSGQPVIGLRTMDEIFDQRARKTLDIFIQAIAGMGLLGLALALVGTLRFDDVCREPAAARDRDSHGHRRRPPRRSEDDPEAGDAPRRLGRRHRPGALAAGREARDGDGRGAVLQLGSSGDGGGGAPGRSRGRRVRSGTAGLAGRPQYRPEAGIIEPRPRKNRN